jgi:hypothetical protein
VKKGQRKAFGLEDGLILILMIMLKNNTSVSVTDGFNTFPSYFHSKKGTNSNVSTLLSLFPSSLAHPLPCRDKIETSKSPRSKGDSLGILSFEYARQGNSSVYRTAQETTSQKPETCTTSGFSLLASLVGLSCLQYNRADFTFTCWGCSDTIGERRTLHQGRCPKGGNGNEFWAVFDLKGS